MLKNQQIVTIRLLDPPLNEFFVDIDINELRILCYIINIDLCDIKKIIKNINNENLYSDYRGCRIAILHPEIYKMQVDAIVIAVNEFDRILYNLRIIIPMPINILEIKKITNIIISSFENCVKYLSFEIGSMIELPYAVLDAYYTNDSIDFISFGTNDLTESTLGILRNSNIMNKYLKNKIFSFNPFTRIDENTVGKLLDLCITKIRLYNPFADIGICGEHGYNNKSVMFFLKRGVNYISCPPHKVPILQISLFRFLFK